MKRELSNNDLHHCLASFVLRNDVKENIHLFVKVTSQSLENDAMPNLHALNRFKPSVFNENYGLLNDDSNIVKHGFNVNRPIRLL